MGMLAGLIVTTLIESLALGPRPMTCAFPAAEPPEATIHVALRARPSLKDLPGLYRVELRVDDDDRLNGSAQPIASTDTPDILVRGSRGTSVHYAIGIDAEGRAALNIVWPETARRPERRITRTGRCRNHERYIRDWTG